MKTSASQDTHAWAVNCHSLYDQAVAADKLAAGIRASLPTVAEVGPLAPVLQPPRERARAAVPLFTARARAPLMHIGNLLGGGIDRGRWRRRGLLLFRGGVLDVGDLRCILGVFLCPQRPMTGDRPHDPHHVPLGPASRSHHVEVTDHLYSSEKVAGRMPRDRETRAGVPRDREKVGPTTHSGWDKQSTDVSAAVPSQTSVRSVVGCSRSVCS